MAVGRVEAVVVVVEGLGHVEGLRVRGGVVGEVVFPQSHRQGVAVHDVWAGYTLVGI